MDGYIKLYRKICDNWLWADKPFSKGQAWIDLIILANHKEVKILQGNEIFTAERGDVVTSTVKLAERWGWSRHKVMTFLDMLESDSMITQKRDSKRTYLTLCNYSVFHDAPTAEEQQKDSVGTSSGQRRDTNKNVKNDKNVKNEEVLPPISPLESAILDFKAFRKGIKKPMTDKAVDLLRSNLTKLAGDDENMKIAILNQSILNSWQGLYPLKDGGQPKPYNSSFEKGVDSL